MRLTNEVDTEVCSASVIREHPELFHYTTKPGFEGIICSRTLWAGHFKDFPDSEEVIALKTPLTKAMVPLFDAGMKEVKLNRAQRRRGSLHYARNFVNSLYRSTFEATTSFTKLEAFTTSFSTHATADDYVRENGLASQWSEYAKDGFCIVFDTGALCRSLDKEWSTHYWVHLNLSPVRYAFHKVPLLEHFPELIYAARSSVGQLLAEDPEAEIAVPEFLRGATLLKQPSFHTEHEVRLAAIPGTDVIRRRLLAEQPTFVDLPISPTFLRPGSTKRALAIFAGCDAELPIKRVIVGPSPLQREHAELALSLLPHVPIVLSKL